MSGMTRSMPSISSSGNMRPASMTTMSSPHSTASMFLPISPTPPSGTIRSGVLELAKERDLLHRFLFRLLYTRGRRQEQRERREISVQRVAQSGLVQGRGGVIDGEDDEAVGGLAGLAVDAGDAHSGEELPHRVPAQGDDDSRTQDLEMAPQPDVACGDLLGQRVTVL